LVYIEAMGALEKFCLRAPQSLIWHWLLCKVFITALPQSTAEVERTFSCLNKNRKKAEGLSDRVHFGSNN